MRQTDVKYMTDVDNRWSDVLHMLYITSGPDRRCPLQHYSLPSVPQWKISAIPFKSFTPLIQTLSQNQNV